MEEEKYMRRALELARHGEFDAAPNPMVGAVIVCDGRIIGEGFHRRCGEPHAEVNAVRSVRRPELLSRSTIYVTLEPCSHYGKTPPCAGLLIDKGIPRVVVGCRDPFPRVAGRGIQMLRDAGRKVVVGVLEEECRALNERFITAHTLRRPWIELKWAETADGFIGSHDSEGRPAPVAVSNPLTAVLAHAERSKAQAIMVGRGTVEADNPRLDLRLWPGTSPRPVVMTSRPLPEGSHLAAREDVLVFSSLTPLPEILGKLYADHGITSLLVEGGTRVIDSFLDAGLWDELRVERSPEILGGGVKAPQIPADADVVARGTVRGNSVERYRRR